MNDMKIVNILSLAFIAAVFLIAGCSKENEWLDVKLNKSDVVPNTLEHFQGLMDNTICYMDFSSIALLGADNYFIRLQNWEQQQPVERNAYIWAAELAPEISAWSSNYEKVFYANAVLDGLTKIDAGNKQEAYDNVKGSALFLRAFTFYNLAQVFAKPYSESASTDPGIPVRLTADINVRSARGTVQETYDQILKDLAEAEQLLPVVPLNRFRPSKAAAQGLRARVLLNMERYDDALAEADKALSRPGSMIDFNTLDPNAFIVFPNYHANHPEIIFYAFSASYGMLSIGPWSFTYIDHELYDSYHENDLRKVVFYKAPMSAPEEVIFQGSYNGNFVCFSGIARNELMLIRAECYARQSKVTEAMNELNNVLRSRWVTGTYVDFTAGDPEEALRIILMERRKELPFTGQLRWEDLRRLNKDPRFQKTLTRTLGSKTYTLPPNDNRYVYPISESEIRLSGLEQNPR